MPQLDFFSIANQFFWGIFYFIFFYVVITYYVIPSIFSSIFARNFYISNSKTDSSDALFYSLTAFFTFSSVYQDCSNLLINFYDDIKTSSFSYYVTVFEAIVDNFNLVEAVVLFFINVNPILEK